MKRFWDFKLSCAPPLLSFIVEPIVHVAADDHGNESGEQLVVQRVKFIAVEDGHDLIVSFALLPSGQCRLTLIRSPQYENLLPEVELNVMISPPDRGGYVEVG